MKNLINFIIDKYKYSRLESLYDIIRYDIWRFLGNIWRFRKELWNHAWWDYRYTLEMLFRSISIMEKGMHKGLEIRETREKKILKMKRLLLLLDNNLNDRYIELAEKELGINIISKDFNFNEVNEVDSSGGKLFEMFNNITQEEEDINKKIYQKSYEIQESQWNEIWEILKGKNYNEIMNNVQNKTTNQNTSSQDWNDLYDGSGLNHWWD